MENHKKTFDSSSFYSSFSTLYCDVLKELYTTKKFTNLILHPEAKKDFEVKVHKEILLFESQLFNILFKNPKFWDDFKAGNNIELYSFNELNLKSLVQLIYLNYLDNDFVKLQNLVKLMIFFDMHLEYIKKTLLFWWFVHKGFKTDLESTVLNDIFRSILDGKGTLELTEYGNSLLPLKGAEFKNFILKSFKKYVLT